ncbi:hypothetical protein NA57DRAFT_35573 [Rhizodiscina lignyota]|uniref:laccase n=1 Tax=Rhizodiscina lignyota TaxID=1504668 RepID=A0A9P4IN61_9PEZI|nr:hypothetical protein NA57DRAFT_35573 [Rhizodiscina lignyota]
MFSLIFSILFPLTTAGITHFARRASSSANSTASVTSTSSAAISTCTGNSASDRSTWCDFSIDTDYYSDGPTTGETVEYWFEITNTTASPDGVERIVLAVNGSIPGPTIEANWGDTVVVHVTNSLENNGTGLHWHGIRQNWTNPNDGVPSLTQCPIAPGESMTYTWKAVQYGTTWYHSHFSLQAWEGVFGPIVIHGPSTADWDVDLGPLTLVDWSHETVDALYSYAQTVGPPTLDNGLINGTNTYNDSGSVVGSRFETTFSSGTKYLIRVINSAIDTYFKFSMDNHTMTVIASDLVPITPYTTEVLDITMGQRYDIIVEADQSTADYWMRAIPQSSCSENANADDIKGIIRYDSSSTSDPTSTGYSNNNECVDEDSSNLVPYLSQTVGTITDSDTGDDLSVALSTSGNLFKWRIGSTTMEVEWENPTLLQIYNNDTDWTDAEAVIELDDAGEWVYFIIESTLTVPHPIHLHGHDFYVMASAGSATYNSSVTLNYDNPPRRDVATLLAAGYLVIAFKTDNPGAWLMHCHIGWHTSEGLDMQFVERYTEARALIDFDVLNSTCSAWETYVDGSGVTEQDSGV